VKYYQPKTGLALDVTAQKENANKMKVLQLREDSVRPSISYAIGTCRRRLSACHREIIARCNVDSEKQLLQEDCESAAAAERKGSQAELALNMTINMAGKCLLLKASKGHRKRCY